MRRLGRKLIILFGAILLLVWTVAPIYWLINISLMSGAERTKVPTFSVQVRECKDLAENCATTRSSDDG